MTFTEEDATDEAKIKKEAGSSMAKTAAKSNPTLYQAFEDVCESKGIEPSTLLGARLVRVIQNEAYAERLNETEIDPSTVRAEQIKKEDIQFVKQLADELGIGDSEEQHPLEKMVEERIKRSGGPFVGATSSLMGDGGGQNSQQMDALANELRHISSKMEELESRIDEKNNNENVSSEEKQKDTDEIFGSGGGENVREVETETEDETGEVDDNNVPTSPEDAKENGGDE